MSITTPPVRPGPPRRTLLAGALGAALLGGCSADGPGPRAAERTATAGRLRERTARDARALLVRYDATAEAHPDLAERLRPLRAAVARHAEAFERPDGSGPASASPGGPATAPGDGGRAGPGADGRTGAGTGPPGDGRGPGRTTSSVGPVLPEVPEDAERALAALAAAERRAADTRTAALADAPPELARLLASVAAAGAVHAYLLTEGD